MGRMRWALSEAILHESRIKASKADLTRASGVLGFEPAEGNAASIHKATMQAAENFCQPGLGAPRNSDAEENQTNLKVDNACRSSVRIGFEICTASGPRLQARRHHRVHLILCRKYT